MITKGFFSRKEITVAANSTSVVNVTGSAFVCTASSGTFNLGLDNGERFPMRSGLAVELHPEDTFTRLSFENPAAAAITVEFYAGTGRVNLFVVDAKIPPTRLVGEVLTIAAGLSATRAGTDTGCRRKQIVVTNLSDTLDIELTDSVGDPVDSIFPRTKWTMETDDTIYIKNPNGGPVDVAVSEFFYRS